MPIGRLNRILWYQSVLNGAKETERCEALIIPDDPVGAVARPPVAEDLTVDPGPALQGPGARDDGNALVLDLLGQRRAELLRAWVSAQEFAPGFRRSTANDDDLLRQSSELLDVMEAACRARPCSSD